MRRWIEEVVQQPGIKNRPNIKYRNKKSNSKAKVDFVRLRCKSQWSSADWELFEELSIKPLIRITSKGSLVWNESKQVMSANSQIYNRTSRTSLRKQIHKSVREGKLLIQQVIIPIRPQLCWDSPTPKRIQWHQQCQKPFKKSSIKPWAEISKYGAIRLSSIQCKAWKRQYVSIERHYFSETRQRE